MSTSVKEMIAEAKASVPDIDARECMTIMNNPNVLIVDVRDHPEIANSGKIKGALHVSRGMLEFKADANMPMHDPQFSKDKTVILYCASGGRSALAGKTLIDLGYSNVKNLGAFNDWVAAGGSTENI